MAKAGQGVALPAAGALLASAALSLVSEQPARGKPLVAFRRPLPDLCPIHRVTGHKCPGCGMTRALVLLWRGRPRQAIRSNPASPFVFAALLYLAFAPYLKPQEPETREL
jgi:hypothetical protein